jgi:hypothetical protein
LDVFKEEREMKLVAGVLESGVLHRQQGWILLEPNWSMGFNMRFAILSTDLRTKLGSEILSPILPGCLWPEGTTNWKRRSNHEIILGLPWKPLRYVGCGGCYRNFHVKLVAGVAIEALMLCWFRMDASKI